MFHVVKCFLRDIGKRNERGSQKLNKTVSSLLNPPNCSLQRELRTLEARLSAV